MVQFVAYLYLFWWIRAIFSPKKSIFGSLELYIRKVRFWDIPGRTKTDVESRNAIIEERLKFHTKFDSKFESVNLKHSIGWFIKLRTLGRQLYFSALLCDSIYDKDDKYDISNISISRSVSVMWRVHSFSYFYKNTIVLNYIF